MVAIEIFEIFFIEAGLSLRRPVLSGLSRLAGRLRVKYLGMLALEM